MKTLKNLYIISDIVDPKKGSEFRIALKPLEILGKDFDVKFKSINLLVARRNDNIENINNWLQQKEIKNVVVKEFPFQNADAKGNHRNSFFYIKDLVRFYKKCRNVIPKTEGSIIFKCGQVNWFFCLIFLLNFKKSKFEKMLCAPVSGFIYIKIKDCINLSIKSKIYYLFYNLIIFLGRIIFKFLFMHKKNLHFLFATYDDSKVFFNQNIENKIYSEIDFDNLKTLNEKPKQPQNNQISVLWSGQLIDRKNPILALQIAKQILQKTTNIKFNFVGEGPLQNEVSNFIKSNNLFENINYIPKLERTAFLELIKQNDFVFITSLREVNSLFFIESVLENKKIFALKNSGLVDFKISNVVLHDTNISNTIDAIATSFYNELQKPIVSNNEGFEYVKTRYELEKNNLLKLLQTL